MYRLDPYVDDAGILRVGGGLRQTDLSFNENSRSSYLNGPTILRCYSVTNTSKYTITFLVSKETHIELLERMDTSSLICGL